MTPSPRAAPRRLYSVLAIVATVSIGGLTVAALHHAVHDISYRGLMDSLAATRARSSPRHWQRRRLVSSSPWRTILALRYARAGSPIVSTMLASFCGYALGNFIGFTLLSGGAVRYRLYAAVGVSSAKIARITLFIAAAFGIGAVTTIGLGLALRSREIANLYGFPHQPLRLIAVLILATTSVLLVGCALRRRNLRLGRVTIELPSLGLVLFQMAVTITDIVIASSVLWLLLPRIGIDFPAFVVIYTAALSLGFLSHAPGGIGVFEAAMLYPVGTFSAPSAVLGALVAYRAIYFLLPFTIAALLLAAIELRRLQRSPRPAPASNGN